MRKVFIEELNDNVVYEMIISERFIDDYGRIKVYGMRVYRESILNEIYEVEDISSRADEVIALLELAAKHKMLPVHLEDVVYDFISYSF
ncbi:MAG: hypothetical protein IKV41_00835 [Oscillospiraceae bacterium]|nr:hypothetical protein [Oscillospiraceae bacterium]